MLSNFFLGQSKEILLLDMKGTAIFVLGQLSNLPVKLSQIDLKYSGFLPKFERVFLKK